MDWDWGYGYGRLSNRCSENVDQVDYLDVFWVRGRICICLFESKDCFFIGTLLFWKQGLNIIMGRDDRGGLQMMEKTTGLCWLIWAIFCKMPFLFAYETTTVFWVLGREGIFPFEKPIEFLWFGIRLHLIFRWGFLHALLNGWWFSIKSLKNRRSRQLTASW